LQSLIRPGLFGSVAVSNEETDVTFESADKITFVEYPSTAVVLGKLKLEPWDVQLFYGTGTCFASIAQWNTVASDE